MRSSKWIANALSAPSSVWGNSQYPVVPASFRIARSSTFSAARSELFRWVSFGYLAATLLCALLSVLVGVWIARWAALVLDVHNARFLGRSTKAACALRGSCGTAAISTLCKTDCREVSGGRGGRSTHVEWRHDPVRRHTTGVRRTRGRVTRSARPRRPPRSARGKMKVSKTYFYDLLHGQKTSPSWQLVQAFADFFKVQLD